MDQTKSKLEQAYGLLFPFDKFYGEYGKLCQKVEKEIKALCASNQYAAVIMIGKTIGMKFDRSWSALEMCQQVLKEVSDLCLSDEKLAQSYVLYEKTGMRLAQEPIGNKEYVVMYHPRGRIEEPSDILGVFSTKEKAEKAAAKHIWGFYEPYVKHGIVPRPRVEGIVDTITRTGEVKDDADTWKIVEVELNEYRK